MAVYADREHYIPLRKSDLIQLLCQDDKLPIVERQPFRHFCQRITAMFHFQYLRQLEDLKDTYAPFDPDADTRPVQPLTGADRQAHMNKLFDSFTAVLEKANYKHLTWNDVVAAMEGGASDLSINMEVDATVFERIEIFCRGDDKETHTRRLWPWFWKKETKKLELYRRLVLMVKLRRHRRIKRTINTDTVYIKVFKNVPKLDLETLLPGARVEWPALKKWLFRLSLFAGLGMAIFGLYRQLREKVTDLNTVYERWLHFWQDITDPTVVLPIIVLGGFAWRQYSAYRNTLQAFTLQLSENLYFQNLDNNVGVMTRLMDDAEEQECRETLLAYYMLWKHAPEGGWTEGQLDDYIEMYIEAKTGLKIDFEVDDALGKLEQLRMVERKDDLYRALPLQVVQERLEEIWKQKFHTLA